MVYHHYYSTYLLLESRSTGKSFSPAADFHQESRYPVRKRLIYLQGFDNTWQTAPSQNMID